MPAQSRAPVILLTRPAEQAARFVAVLRGRFPGIRVVSSPLTAPQFVRPDLPPRDWAAVIFTAQTGVRSAQGMLDAGALPRLAYCVGDQTAATAEQAGFEAMSASGAAEDLVNLVLTRGQTGPLVHLCGRESRGDVAGRLTQMGIETHAVVTYGQEPCPLTEAAADLLRGTHPVVAPVFSPRAGALLAQECVRVGASASLQIVAISQEAGRGFPPEGTTIAKRPDADAMLDAIASRLNLAPPP